MSFMFFVYLITGLLYVYIGVFSFVNNSKNKLNRIFFILCLDLALWAILLALMNTKPDMETATTYRRVATFNWSTVYCLFLCFTLILAEKDGICNKLTNLILFYLPAVASIYIYFFHTPIGYDKIIKTSIGWVYNNSSGRSLIVDLYLPVYCLVYVSLCIFLIYRWGKDSPIKRINHQMKIIVSAIIIVLILGLMTDIIMPVLKISVPPLTVTFILLPVYAIWYSNKRFRLMNPDPRSVVLDVIETMSEGMIITNYEHVIKDVNFGALSMLGYSFNELKEKHISVVLENGEDLPRIEANDRKELLLTKKNNEKLPVLLTSSSLCDEWNDAYGNVLIFQDLTEIKKVESELIKSHNELEQKVLERTQELNTANEELRNEIQSRIEAEQKIWTLAYYDQLTGLPNKRLFLSYLDKKIHENLRNELTLAVLYIDLDSFKMINDTMGYAKGEELLKQVSERLLKCLRVSDTVARVTGDEFLVLIQNNPDEKAIDIVASKLVKSFHKPFIISGNEVHITASIGVAIYPLDGENADTLIENADIAMYRAKERGKDKFEICTPMIKAKLVETMKFTNQLYRAVGRKEFILHYQPQVDIRTGNIVGFEALIRWNHPEIGLIQPEKFISIAEKTGLIIPISEWVLETACRQNKEWQEQGAIFAPMAVNLSAKQLVEYDIVDAVTKILNKTGLDPSYLELEVTESVLLEDVNFIRATLSRLSKMGIRISIDDFGTKYSSLYYLKQLPISRVKIDMNFIQGITINHKDEAIIDAIISLARTLEIDVLAEGVETLKQMEFLKKSNCFVIQGFYLYKPMTANSIIKLLSK